MTDHIAFAYALDGPDRGRPLTGDGDISKALHDPSPAWLHLQADHPDTDPWIDAHLDWLDPSVRDALTDAHTRPRALRIGDGLLVNLRGINFNAGQDPEDMVSVRLYIDSARIVSLSRFRLRSVETLAQMVADGSGPDRSGGLLAALIERLTDRIEEQVADLEDRADRLEEAAIATPEDASLRTEVADQRLELTELRRFMGPQREAVRDASRVKLAWLTDEDTTKIAEQTDQLLRVTEALEATREQLQTIRDEIEGARAERLNKNLYVLSVISAIFLPLGFLTGLMGINVGGMPGVNNPYAFWVFAGALIAITAIAVWLMRRFKIF
ncbi:Zinc transport protein ZntB [Rhodobacteraceae bacterium THAF1]|uniref:zinc transporter ZntB n=1 Tax=Palleronia sp. THAF1 TaxID=2587842 RepID=UPI000F41D40F|nr:zinc transporter ZntB [Palleronia sp. THAF1]QFU09572.1 Zinc transport protein ZntB [Palleronia sp. THAF1]VDC20063.1 Zinc transport protein ZntB [Rhodobacteraceae bacterium THAF1]